MATERSEGGRATEQSDGGRKPRRNGGWSNGRILSGAVVLLFGGKYAGQFGVVDDVARRWLRVTLDNGRRVLVERSHVRLVRDVKFARPARHSPSDPPGQRLRKRPRAF